MEVLVPYLKVHQDLYGAPSFESWGPSHLFGEDSILPVYLTDLRTYVIAHLKRK